MKNKIILLLVLSVGLIGGTINTFAQNSADKVLVSAGGKTLKQADINILVKFYEWAFQAEFNSTQRRDFQKYTEQEFRGNPAESRQTIDDIAKTFPQIMAVSEDVREETRQNFLAAFLPEAQKNRDDNSQMLLSIYEAANGALPQNESDDSNSSEEDRFGTYETVKKVPVGNFAAMVGKWVSGNTGSITTTESGVYMGGNASRHTYQFSANGTVEYTGIMNMMTGGCRMQIFKTAKGKAVLSGDTLTINWQPASFSREDSCSPSKNYKKTLPAETETFKVNFETFYDDKQLCLITTDRMCFSRD